MAEDTYTPTSGMKAAARRALKWKEDGKATGAGTPVGWGRATDIVAGRPMSLSTVKRMFSFFSRHEVDKKGKGFYDGPEFPSNGRIMWEAWGGDAGFSWSRAIVEREKKKVEKAWIGSPFSLIKGQKVEDLGVEELKQLINYYKQRSSDLEFSVLQLQMKLNKIISLQESKPATKTVVEKK